MFSSLRKALSCTRTCSTIRFASTPLWLPQRCLSTSRILCDAPRVVYLGNLPYNTELEEIKSRAEPFGALARITMPNDYKERPGGFANVEFQEEISARKFYDALQKEGLVVSGRKANVLLVETHQQTKLGLPESKTLHVTNFPSQPTVSEVEMYFERFGQTVSDIRIGQGYTRPFAHVTFASQEAATEALKTLQMEPIEVDGSSLFVDYAASPSRSRTERQPNNTLFFRGLIAEGELRQLLRPHADEIQKIFFLPQEPSRKHRAGHIICRSISAATTILENYGDQMMLEYARPRNSDDTTERGYRRNRQSRFSKESESEGRSSGVRNSYGGDWGGGRRSEAFYKKQQ
ncbi:hypothetical protein E1B28_013370 [Marasmius oreades]|uniref:RRM domain-containing protein n=1 Tax=Marasmius oreades TaxID=181124 RepID=A0A9P7RQF3_9AGAR|nr:uncharacterized protein E1B28_013370 [Marasmius oreades]KAG7087400.1 hypothetical protein E1B28_013370 [Marasmius oreades]